FLSFSEPFLGDGHADAGCDTLSERTGSSFHSRYPMIFGMAGCFTVELAKPADVVQRDRWLSEFFIIGVHRLDAGEVKNGPDQHGSVTIGKDEPITVRPDRILRVKAHDAIPNRINQRGQRHWRAGMSGFCLLDRIDRE